MNGGNYRSSCVSGAWHGTWKRSYRCSGGGFGVNMERLLHSSYVEGEWHVTVQMSYADAVGGVGWSGINVQVTSKVHGTLR